MRRSKLLALLLAVAMVVSMIVVPAYADEPYAFVLTSEAGSTESVTVAPGESFDLTFATAGTIGYTNVSAIGALFELPSTEWTASFANATSYLDCTILPSDAEWQAGELRVCVVDIMQSIKNTMTVGTVTVTVPENVEAGNYTINMSGIDTANKTATGDTLTVAPVAFTVTVAEPGAAEGTCPACEDHDGNWTEVSTLSGALETGHYKLTADVSITSALTVADGQTVCIDLNGFNITAGATASSTDVTKSYRVFEIAAGGELSVSDSTAATVEGVYTSGVISGGKLRGAKYNNVTYYGETVDKLSRGGNIYNSGTFNLYSGTITGGVLTTGTVSNSRYGGNIYGASGSVINIHGGTVSNGMIAGTAGGAAGTICADPGVGGNIATHGDLHIYGGTISGGRYTGYAPYTGTGRTTNRIFGGNIYVNGGNFTMSGGLVTGGSAVNDFNTAATDKMTAEGYGGNIYLTVATATITGGTISNGTAKATVTSTAETPNASNAATGGGGNIYANKGTLTISDATITGGTSTHRGGNICTVGTTLSIADSTISDGTLGGVATANGGNIYINGGAVEITGTTIRDGTVSNVSTAYGGNVYVNGGSVEITETDIYNGSCTTSGTAERGGNIYLTGAGTITMNSGSIYNGTATYGRGGNVWLADKYKNVFNMHDGEIYGGTADRQRNVAVYGGNFNLYDGTVRAIEGAAADSYTNCLYAQNTNAYINIYGGTVDNKGIKSHVVQATYSNINIYGGTITGVHDAKNAVQSTCSSSAGSSVVNIYGGTINGNVNAANGSGTSYNYLNIYGGDIHSVAINSTLPKTKLYNGLIGSVDSSLNSDYLGCTKAHINDGNLWHVEGLCDTCNHTYVAELPENADVATTHVTVAGAHTFVEGVCSACGEPEPVATTKEAHCAYCNDTVIWTAWDGTVEISTGHHYLTDNTQMLAGVSLSADRLCLDLGGFILTTPETGARAFAVSGTGELNLINGTVDANNVALDDNGGIIYGAGSADHSAHLRLDHVILQNGAVEGSSKYGGNLYLYRTDADITDSQLLAGDSSYRGGNAYITTGSDVNFTRTVISGGNASDRGGNLALNAGNITLTNCTIKDGVAVRGANMLVQGTADVTMDDGTMGFTTAHSGATEYGGNVYITDSDGGALLTVEGGAVISDGKATSQGGNISAMYGNVILNDCTVTNGLCSSNNLGGGNITQYTSSKGGTITVNEGAVISDGKATGAAVPGGGNIYVWASAAEAAYLVVNGGTISGGTYGTNATAGDIYVGAVAAATKGAHGTVNGGNIGIYKVGSTNATFTVADGVITGNNPIDHVNPQETPTVVKKPDGSYVPCTNFADALTAAGTTGTVTLADDVTHDLLQQVGEVTLDLNGKTITADVTGTLDVIDSSGTGAGRIVSTVPFQTVNSEYLPVLVAENTYAVEKVELQSRLTKGADGIWRFVFRIAQTDTSKTNLDDVLGNQDSIQLGVTVKWNDGTQEKTETFYMTNDALYQAYKTGFNGKAVQLKIDEATNNCTLISAAAVVKSVACVNQLLSGEAVEATH